MAWGQRSQGIDDLLQRLSAHDPKLQSITLMRQRQLDGAKDVARLCAALATNPHMTELSLSAHTLDVASAQHLADLLCCPTTRLATVSLGDSSFGDAAMVALCKGVGASTTLTSLDAEHKGLGAAAAGALATALSTCSSLTTLHLGKNALGDAGVTSLCGTSWSHLQHLDLQDVGLTASGLAALADCQGLTGLHTLSCAYNTDLGADAAPHLGRLVGAARKLRCLRLQHTGVGDAGAQAIAGALGAPAAAGDGGALRLKELDLAHTGLGDEGGIALAAALAEPSCPLANLSLEGNRRVTDSTATELHLATARRCADGSQTRGLTHLNLSATGVTPACLEPLSQVQGLQHLALLGCQLGPASAEALIAITKQEETDHVGGSQKVSRFASLRDLVLSACGLDGAAVEALLAALMAGALPGLTSVEIGGNDGCQGEDIHDRVEALRAARPGLGVHWRAGDMGPTEGAGPA